MNGCVIDSSENMDAEIEKAGLSYPVVVKAQVQIGGRGKAGGIRSGAVSKGDPGDPETYTGGYGDRDLCPWRDVHLLFR